MKFSEWMANIPVDRVNRLITLPRCAAVISVVAVYSITNTHLNLGCPPII